MNDLHAMMRHCARPGRVAWIGVRPARRADMVALNACDISDAGLDGDRARAGKRAVTLIQAEHLPAIAAYLDQIITPQQLRRNIVVSGVNLAALKGRDITIGDARLRLTTICAPCSRMEETFGHGGYSAVRGHGGWCAQVVTPGMARMGDAVQPVD